jgi:hypothetical protein
MDKNQTIEAFINNTFTENEIIELHEESSLVCHLDANTIDKDTVKEIKSYGERGYRTNKYGGSICVYYVERTNEIWVEGGF